MKNSYTEPRLIGLNYNFHFYYLYSPGNNRLSALRFFECCIRWNQYKIKTIFDFHLHISIVRDLHFNACAFDLHFYCCIMAPQLSQSDRWKIVILATKQHRSQQAIAHTFNYTYETVTNIVQCNYIQTIVNADW